MAFCRSSAEYSKNKPFKYDILNHIQEGGINASSFLLSKDFANAERQQRQTLLLDVPHRQVVFTIPKTLRVFFKYKRKLLGDLCRLALRALARYFEVVTGSALTPGVIAAIQTFGDRINVPLGDG